MISRRAPKVFFSSYRPPQSNGKSSGQFRQMIIVVLVIIGGYFLTRLPVFQIQHIELSGNPSPAIKTELEKLKGQSLLSAASSNKVREILANNISILNLECDKGIPNTLRCAVAFRQPQFIWQSNSNRYYVDKEGYAYAKVDEDNTTPKAIVSGERSLSNALVAIEDRKKLTVKPGDLLMSEEVVEIFQNIAEHLEQAGIEVDGYFVNTSVLHPGVVASKRADNKPFPKQKIDIYFSASYPVENQIKILDKLLSKSASKIKSYVDLRTAGYIYYK